MYVSIRNCELDIPMEKPANLTFHMHGYKYAETDSGTSTPDRRNWNLGVRLPVSRQFIVDHAVPSGYQGIFVFRQIN